MIKIIKNKLVWIFVVGFVLRMIALSHFVRDYDPAIQEGGDAAEYTNVALNVMAGKGFVSNEQEESLYDAEPVFPTLLAFIYLISGKNFLAARIFNLLMSAGTIFFIHQIGKTIFKNNTVGLISALMVAFHPALIFWSITLLSETVRVFIFSLLLMLFLKFWQNPQKHCLALGIAMGLSILTRISILPFVLLFYVFILIKTVKTRIWKSCVLISAAFLFTLAPWLIRNYNVYGVMTIDGRMLKISQLKTKKEWIEAKQRKYERKLRYAQHLGRDLKYGRLDRIITNYSDGDFELKILPESIAQRRYQENSRLKNKFYEYLLTFWELWRFYPLQASPYSLPMKIVLGLFNSLVFFGGILGMILSFQKFKLSRWLMLSILFLTAFHVYTGGPHARYILPTVPFMALFTSFSAVHLYQKILKDKSLV